MAIAIDWAIKPRPRKRLPALGVVVNLATLGYFKYANFGIDSLNAVLKTAGLEPFAAAHVLLPIGISFFVFQAISYLVDVWRRDVLPARNRSEERRVGKECVSPFRSRVWP